MTENLKKKLKEFTLYAGVLTGTLMTFTAVKLADYVTDIMATKGVLYLGNNYTADSDVQPFFGAQRELAHSMAKISGFDHYLDRMREVGVSNGNKNEAQLCTNMPEVMTHMIYAPYFNARIADTLNAYKDAMRIISMAERYNEGKLETGQENDPVVCDTITITPDNQSDHERDKVFKDVYVVGFQNGGFKAVFMMPGYDRPMTTWLVQSGPYGARAELLGYSHGIARSEGDSDNVQNSMFAAVRRAHGNRLRLNP